MQIKINPEKEFGIELLYLTFIASFAKKSKILEKGKSYFYDKSEKVKSVFAPELIRVRLNENYEVEYQNLEIGYYYEKQTFIIVYNNRYSIDYLRHIQPVYCSGHYISTGQRRNRPYPSL